MGGSITNHLLYADDLCLICPSINSLQRLVGICEEVSLENDILFNIEKTCCMYFPCARLLLQYPPPHVKLYGASLKYVTSFVYLGVHLNPTLSDDDCLCAQLKSLYSRANCINRKFSLCSTPVKKNLFMAYCGQIYGAQLWNSVSAGVLSKCRIAYNNCFRIIMNLRRRCSASTMFVYNLTDSFEARRRKMCYSFLQRLSSSNNIIVQHLLTSDMFYRNSFFQNCYDLLYR